MANRREITLLDHGKRTSLQAFEFAPVKEGCHIELSRGYLVALDLPIFEHSLQISAVQQSFSMYTFSHPKTFLLAAGSFDCKLLIPEWESERHSDIAVYLTVPKGKKGFGVDGMRNS